MSIFSLKLTLTTLLIAIITSPTLAQENLEETVCGLKERFYFWKWSKEAGTPNPELAKNIPHIESISHKTKDGYVLRGYKLKSTLPNGKTLGYLLVIQGNAMLAEQLLADLRLFSEIGLETYILDYRGYGNSEGHRRLKAMISDYQEFANKLPNGKHFLYAISFGGIISLNMINKGVRFDRVLIDSTPSRLSNHGCPVKYDPVVNLPANTSNFLFIAGVKDTRVSFQDLQELIDTAKQRGSQVIVRQDYEHAFRDQPHTHQERMEKIKTFFIEEKNDKGK